MLAQLRKYLIKLSWIIQEKPFHNNHSLEKKPGYLDFDVPMGCYDGAEIGELVGIFILNKISNNIDKNSIGLYREDGLGCFASYLGHKN